MLKGKEKDANMTGFEITQVVLSSGVAGGVIYLIFFSGKFMERISNIEVKVNAIESEIKEIKTDVSDIKVRLGKLEQKNQDNFESEIRLLLKEKSKG